MQLGEIVRQDRPPMFEGPVNDRPDGRLGESRELPGMRLRERVDPAGSRLPRRSHGKAFLEYVIEGCFVEECDGGRARVQSGALRYIAAGAAWVKGVEKPAHWIHRHPMKKLAS